jgi:hypothetical protein
MKALSKLASTAVLLATLATLPSALIAFRYMVHEVTASAPHFTSPIQEAEYWSRAFTP